VAKFCNFFSPQGQLQGNERLLIIGSSLGILFRSMPEVYHFHANRQNTLQLFW